MFVRTPAITSRAIMSQSGLLGQENHAQDRTSNVYRESVRNRERLRAANFVAAADGMLIRCSRGSHCQRKVAQWLQQFY